MSKKIILLTILVFLTVLTINPAFAREDLKLDLNIKSLDASKFPVIQAYVTVTDRDGAYYRNLTESNFAVAENRFKLDSFVVESSLKNMHIVLCLDNSASMKKDMAELQRAAFTFIKGLDPTDKCSILTFNNKTSVLQDFTNDKYALSNAVFQMRARGGTLLYDSLFTAINKCAIVEGKKAIVLFTDGKDESYSGSKPFSRHTLEEVLAHAK
ncbi:MAG TPA: VWA domain-containing protein, partial [Candidatus Wallbacteria bacterium]|nr:VWA domain-containing protein [Candidatus Wallbacteria bacterium]